MQRNLRLDRLRDGTDLVNLEEETVAGLLLDRSLDAERVGDREVVADDLDAGLAGEVAPRLPVVLVEGVLDRHDRVLLDVAEVEVRKLNTGDPLRGVRVRVLEVKVVLALLVELRRGNIQRNLDLALVPGLLNSLREELQ